MARTSVSTITKKKAKKRAVAKEEDDEDEQQVKVDKKSRKKFSKQLRAHQEALQSISKTFKAEEFLDSNPSDNDDENFIRCPRCCFKMNESQVTEGFDTNVINHKTTCPDCAHKFSTIARIGEQYYVWLCEEQTKDQFELWKKERDFEEDEDIISLLATDRPEIVFNAYKYSDKDNFKTVKDAVENWLEV